MQDFRFARFLLQNKQLPRLCVALIAAILAQSIVTAAGWSQALEKPVKAVSHGSARDRESAHIPNRLPVRRVSLYKNGVGFFEHIGSVSGNQQVEIDFTTAQLNDVLQTLTAIDLNGGRIARADPNSTTPLDPKRQGWDLDSEPKPVETTSTAYRFRIVAAPGETVRLHIGEPYYFAALSAGQHEDR